jgi:hypothetical protein
MVLQLEGIKCQSQVGTFQKEMTVGYKLFETAADQLSQCRSPHLEAALSDRLSICPSSCLMRLPVKLYVCLCSSAHLS